MEALWSHTPSDLFNFFQSTSLPQLLEDQVGMVALTEQVS